MTNKERIPKPRKFTIVELEKAPLNIYRGMKVYNNTCDDFEKWLQSVVLSEHRFTVILDRFSPQKPTDNYYERNRKIAKALYKEQMRRVRGESDGNDK